jgi:hypothetical protein
MKYWWLIAGLAFSACKENNKLENDTDTGKGTEDAGLDTASAEEETDTASAEEETDTNPGDPLLNRPAKITLECHVSREMTPFEIPWYDFDLVQSPGGTNLARAEMEMSSLIENSENRVVSSSLAPDGTLGTPTLLYEATYPTPIGVHATLANAQDGYALAWVQGEHYFDTEKKLVFALVDPDKNTIIGTPSTLASTTGVLEDPILVAKENGHAIVWVSGEKTANELMFASIGTDGASSQPKSIAKSCDLNLGEMVRFKEGFALTFERRTSYETGFETWMVIMNAEGTPIGDPIRLNGDIPFPGWNGTQSSLIARRDELLVAWSVTEGDDMMSSAATTLHVARFDAAGTLVSQVYELQAPVTDRELINPAWIDLGDDVGLLWSEGSIIYICGGCIPDNQIRFVVLDGDDLAPKSDVVTLVNESSEVGLMAPAAARQGDDVIIVASIQHHVWAEGASGTVSCSQSD